MNAWLISLPFIGTAAVVVKSLFHNDCKKMINQHFLSKRETQVTNKFFFKDLKPNIKDSFSLIQIEVFAWDLRNLDQRLSRNSINFRRRHFSIDTPWNYPLKYFTEISLVWNWELASNKQQKQSK